MTFCGQKITCSYFCCHKPFDLLQAKGGSAIKISSLELFQLYFNLKRFLDIVAKGEKHKNVRLHLLP